MESAPYEKILDTPLSIHISIYLALYKLIYQFIHTNIHITYIYSAYKCRKIGPKFSLAVKNLYLVLKIIHVSPKILD